MWFGIIYEEPKWNIVTSDGVVQWIRSKVLVREVLGSNLRCSKVANFVGKSGEMLADGSPLPKIFSYFLGFFRFCLCQVLIWHSTKPLQSVWHVALGKKSLCRAAFTEQALGKAFAECERGLCRVPEHSAKSHNPVVCVNLHLFHQSYIWPKNVAGLLLWKKVK